MTQSAVVEQCYADGWAQVRVVQKSACGHDCAECGSVCGKVRILHLRVRNPLDVRSGERVTLQTGTGKVIRAAALVYLLPLAALLGGALLGLLLGAGDRGQALLGLGGLLLGCGLAVGINRWIRRDRPLEYTIIAKESPESDGMA